MSKFKFADQLGFSPPIVFEEDTVSEEDVFYKGPIKYQSLLKKLRQRSLLLFDFGDFVDSGVVVDQGTYGISIEYPESDFILEDENGLPHNLALLGELNNHKGLVQIGLRKTFFSFTLKIGSEIEYQKGIQYKEGDRTAIILKTKTYKDYSLLSEYIRSGNDKEEKKIISRKFDDAFRNVKNDASLKWLYEKAPLFVLQQRGDAILIEDLKKLVIYDLEGALSWFKDSSTAIMKLVTGFKNPKVLYDHFNEHPEEAIRIYDALQGVSEVQFATLLTMLAQLYTREVKNDNIIQGASRRDVTFNIGKGYRLNSDILIKDDQKNIKLERFSIQTRKVNVDAGLGETVSIDKNFNIPIEGSTIFHPLDLVTLKDANGNDEVPVCALEVKYLSDEAEWETVINTTVVIANIVSILISAGVLSAGATGLTAIIAATDIAISTIDLVVVLRRPELKGTQEGAWLDRNWDAISGTFGIISVSSALRQGLIKNGPRIIGKLKRVKDASAIAIRKRIQVLLFQVIINDEIANFGKVSFKIVPIDQVRLIPNLKILQFNVDRLWKLGVMVLESQVDGKAFYGLMYQGEVILSGAAKEIDNFVKTKIFTYAVKDKEIIKLLDKIAERIRNIGFNHIPTSGVIVTANTKKGTYLLGSFNYDLQFILKQLDYPKYLDANELAKGFEFLTPSGQKFNLLNVSEQVVRSFAKKGGFFNRVNAKWVDKAVERGEDIVLITREEDLYRIIKIDGKRKRVITGYGKEVHRLEWKHNYRYNPRTHQMVPPAQAEGLRNLTKFDDHKIVTIYK